MKTDKFSVEDICLFVYTENPAMKQGVWKLGRITEISKNGRKVTIEFPATTLPGKPSKLKTIVRCPRDVCIISAADDVNLNSNEYFDRITRET